MSRSRGRRSAWRRRCRAAMADRGGLKRARPARHSPAAEGHPTHQQIAALAYSYWEARGRQGGSPLEDWLRAENDLLGK
ncbi:MAG: DUF2934 domain-containing protein [Bryobacteraceae bacterium]